MNRIVTKDVRNFGVAGWQDLQIRSGAHKGNGFWYNICAFLRRASVSGRRDITLQGNRRTKCESFKAGDTDAEVRRNALARLSSYFCNGNLTASFEIEERPFLFFDGCKVARKI